MAFSLNIKKQSQRAGSNSRTEIGYATQINFENQFADHDGKRRAQ
jgi:hypothetical protein